MVQGVLLLCVFQWTITSNWLNWLDNNKNKPRTRGHASNGIQEHYADIWMSEWVDRGLQIDKILIDRLIELLIGLTQKEIVSWNQILWVLSKCILHFYSEYLISQKVIIILDDFILRLTNREHFKWKIHFRVLVSESSRMYVCLNLLSKKLHFWQF